MDVPLRALTAARAHKPPQFRVFGYVSDPRPGAEERARRACIYIKGRRHRLQADTAGPRWVVALSWLLLVLLLLLWLLPRWRLRFGFRLGLSCVCPRVDFRKAISRPGVRMRPGSWALNGRRLGNGLGASGARICWNVVAPGPSRLGPQSVLRVIHDRRGVQMGKDQC